MVDLKLFQNSQFSLATASAILNYIGIYCVTFLMPFFLIQGRMFSSAEAGLLLAAQPIMMAIVAPISGTLSDRRGTRWLAAIGMAVLTVGLVLLAQLDAESSIGTIVLALVIMGFGTGLFISPNNSALMGSAPRQRQGIAAGILATARNFGMVLGVGIAGSIFTTLLARGEGNYLAGGEVFFRAIQVSLLVAAAFTLLGVFTSISRVDRK
jgi:MFS family permease